MLDIVIASHQDPPQSLNTIKEAHHFLILQHIEKETYYILNFIVSTNLENKLQYMIQIFLSTKDFR